MAFSCAHSGHTAGCCSGSYEPDGCRTRDLRHWDSPIAESWPEGSWRSQDSPVRDGHDPRTRIRSGALRIPMPEVLGHPGTRRVQAQALAASCKSGSRSVGAISRMSAELGGPRSAPTTATGAVIRGDRGGGANSCDRYGLGQGVWVGDALYADSGVLLPFAPTKIGPVSGACPRRKPASILSLLTEAPALLHRIIPLGASPHQAGISVLASGGSYALRAAEAVSRGHVPPGDRSIAERPGVHDGN